MKLIDIIILMTLLIILAGIVRIKIKHKKEGKTGCSACPYKKNCDKK